MELTQALLDSLPQGGAIIRRGLVITYNAAMLHTLLTLAPKAQLVVGAPLPAPLLGLLAEGSGTVLHRDIQYEFSTQIVGEDCLFLLSKVGKKMERKTVSQFLHRLREGMSLTDVGLEGILTAVGAQRIDKVGALYKSHYCMVRALEHMELLSGERTGGPVSQMELVGYCQRLQMDIAPLMRSLETTVEVVPKGYALFVEGEEWLLQRLILGFVSNAIQEGGRHISLKLSKSNRRCKILISDDCPPQSPPTCPEDSLRRTLLAEPDSLDMTTARLLAKELHGSILVSKTKQGGNQITISLPLAAGSHLPLKAPDISQGTRYNQMLVEFAQVLPGSCFIKGDEA